MSLLPKLGPLYAEINRNSNKHVPIILNLIYIKQLKNQG